MASSPAQNRAGPTDVPDASRAHVSGWMRLPRHRGRRAHTWQDVLFDERDQAWMDAQVSKLLIVDHSCGARGAPGTAGDHRRAARKDTEERHADSLDGVGRTCARLFPDDARRNLLAKLHARTLFRHRAWSKVAAFLG